MQLRELVGLQEIMNKLMKSYLDRVRSDPKLYIQNRSPTEKLVGAYPRGESVPILYVDSFLPSFVSSFLFGLEFDFLMLEVLVVAAMDRAMRLGTNDLKSGIALGGLVAYILSSALRQLRMETGSRNIARHVLVDDEKFLFS